MDQHTEWRTTKMATTKVNIYSIYYLNLLNRSLKLRSEKIIKISENPLFFMREIKQKTI